MPKLLNKAHQADPLWHVQAIMLILIALQLALPSDILPWPRLLVPACELVVMLGVQFATPNGPVFRSSVRRATVVAQIALVGVVNVVAFRLLITGLFGKHAPTPGHLLLSALNVYVTSVIVFALLYWEVDGGGPGVRRATYGDEADFLFPQQTLADQSTWHPTFIDYLYVSITNMTAFSPTDTMPLSRRIKMVMAVQSAMALSIVALVAARAINRL